MTWDERQRAMLAEMGFRVQAGSSAAAPAVEAEPEPIEVAAPLPAAPAMRARPPVAPAPPVARAAAPANFAGLDLPALREAVAVCRACGLCEQRGQAVFGVGGSAATWLVVTDPPDEADDASGEALGGDAGRLLDRMLAAAGQRRVAKPGAKDDSEAPTAFVTPLVKCRPPRGRAPTPAELDACEAVLARQIELLQPRLVLAMGVQAARRLTGLGEPLGRLRGRVHSWGGLPLVVTYHPAYLLRSPADKAGAWDDLCLANMTLQQP
jgi:DNA polymerase